MQLVINSYGSYLQKNGDCFKVKKDEQVFEVSVKKVSSIMIATAAYITTDAIKLAMDNNIDIVFLDDFGDPYGRVWHSKLGSTTLIRRRQLEAEASAVGFNLARGWIAQKIENQLDFLKDLKKNRPDDYDTLAPYIAKIAQLNEDLMSMKGSLDEKRGSIMGIEGMASLTYFEALNRIMPDAWHFTARTREP